MMSSSFSLSQYSIKDTRPGVGIASSLGRYADARTICDMELLLLGDRYSLAAVRSLEQSSVIRSVLAVLGTTMHVLGLLTVVFARSVLPGVLRPQI